MPRRRSVDARHDRGDEDWTAALFLIMLGAVGGLAGVPPLAWFATCWGAGFVVLLAARGRVRSAKKRVAVALLVGALYVGGLVMAAVAAFG